MNFLRKEVQGEEMVQLARTGFGPQHNFRKNNASVECVIQSELATASALVSLDSEVLGITDPTETVKEREDLPDFREKMRIFPEGRYEVELPRKSNLMNLCDNKELAWKRHEKMIDKLKCGNFLMIIKTSSGNGNL
ncbi:uncharacterized protein TNCV_3728241 [Trichonephila clavipes]|uniref:Uncharacterized protein n=1 Tax=Trichonephila clavipes TaxID=2585209 RepID=A0A8X6R1S4_TRICX|nr:uncharacterized protein TNCV_3728241 [Trichonephila clavipes]